MKAYLIAANESAMSRNLGVEIIAAGPVEAANKYLAFGHDYESEGDRDPYAAVFLRHPDGSTDNIVIDNPSFSEPDDDDDFHCPHCNRLIDPADLP